MKTSIKLIFAAVFLVILSLVAFDYLLSAAYRTGEYKNPYRSYVNLKFRDFDTVNVVSSTIANVKFVQGPFNVRVDTNALQYVQVKQTGRQLRIEVNTDYKNIYNVNPYVLVISCPKLSTINADATYIADRQPVTDTITNDSWNMRKLLIDGFRQDSLSITQNYGSSITLSNSRISVLKASVGSKTGSGSKITLLNNNQFDYASIQVLNRSRFFLDGNVVKNLEYHLADSAKIVLTGAAQNASNKFKPSQK